MQSPAQLSDSVLDGIEESAKEEYLKRMDQGKYSRRRKPINPIEEIANIKREFVNKATNRLKQERRSSSQSIRPAKKTDKLKSDGSPVYTVGREQASRKQEARSKALNLTTSIASNSPGLDNDFIPKEGKATKGDILKSSISVLRSKSSKDLVKALNILETRKTDVVRYSPEEIQRAKDLVTDPNNVTALSNLKEAYSKIDKIRRESNDLTSIDDMFGGKYNYKSTKQDKSGGTATKRALSRINKIDSLLKDSNDPKLKYETIADPWDDPIPDLKAVSPNKRLKPNLSATSDSQQSDIPTTVNTDKAVNITNVNTTNKPNTKMGLLNRVKDRAKSFLDDSVGSKYRDILTDDSLTNQTITRNESETKNTGGSSSSAENIDAISNDNKAKIITSDIDARARKNIAHKEYLSNMGDNVAQVVGQGVKEVGATMREGVRGAAALGGALLGSLPKRSTNKNINVNSGTSTSNVNTNNTVSGNQTTTSNVNTSNREITTPKLFNGTGLLNKIGKTRLLVGGGALVAGGLLAGKSIMDKNKEIEDLRLKNNIYNRYN